MLRSYLQNRLLEIRRHHEKGATGEQVVAALTDLTDEVIERIYKAVLQNLPARERWKFEDGLAIVALGGYGRGERSPYSDIDIMFLHRPSLESEIEKISGVILRNLWDVGFQVGHSTRTVNDCVTIGKADLTVRTSLMEARYLTGSRELFDRFRSRYQRKVVHQQPTLFARAKIKSRQAEWEQFGTTTYLLEPHIKKSRGGLRDIHLMRWLAQCYHQTSSLDLLKQQGILSKQDHRVLSEAQEFLWRIRNEMHFNAGRCQDSLTFEEQVRLAFLWGYHDSGPLLAVEQLMQRYYDHTTAIAEITGRYVEGMTARTFWHQLLKRINRRRVGDGFWLSGDELSILPEFRNDILSGGDRLLSLFRLAQKHSTRLSVETQSLLTTMSDQWTPEQFASPEAYRVFMDILSSPTGVADALRELHRFRILEQLLPGLKRVRALMQFNQYHKYTVDEHCLKAVEEAEKIAKRGDILSKVFSEIPSRAVLYLTLLSHDLGKGLVAGEHSEQGAAIATESAQALGLDSSAAQHFIFLVREHLLMTHVAFRRDTSDDSVLLQFAKAVATPEVLKMLYIMTLADLMAVGPGMLTAWKQDLLAELFRKTLEILTGETIIVAEEEKVRRVKEFIQKELGSLYDPGWLDRQLAAMTTRYLIATPPERILIDLKRIHELPPQSVKVYAQNESERNLTEYSIYTFDDITPGIFYKMTGVLATKGLQIISATITTWSNNVVVDTFWVQDPDYSGSPTEDRLEEVKEAIEQVLLGRLELDHLVSSSLRIGAIRSIFPWAVPVQIELDNSISEKYTIIEVFSPDRPGLLSAIAKAIFMLGLSVQTAKVATQLDQIVDIFHVTDRAGQKIADPDRIRHLKQTLSQEIEHYLEVSRVR